MNLNQAVSRNVDVLRLDKGLRQEDVGTALGLSQSSADRRLKGQTPWSVDELDSIATFLGVTLGQLLEWPDQ